MEIRKGYKKTEIGVIPDEWQVKSIEDVLGFSGGSQPSREKFIFSPKEGYIRLLQIRDYKTDKYATFIPLELSNKTCNKDDIMIGRYGPPIFQILRGLEGAYNVALIKAVPKDNFTKNYAYHFLRQNTLFEFVEKLSQRTSGQTGIDLKELRGYKIPLPPLPEQKAIAEVLSDTDKLIQALEKLIAKKQLIKQGAMQKLLTPKDGWEVKKLGKICEIRKGEQLSKRFMTNLGKYPVLNGGIEKSGFTTKFNTNENTVTISEGGNSCGFVNHIKEKFWCGGHCYKLQDLRVDKKFLYYLLKYNELYLQSLRVGSGLPNIQRKEIESFELFYPSILEEQKAIAQVLSDMDAEIETLQKKKQKYERIKKGTMELLLTGKIRLNKKEIQS